MPRMRRAAASAPRLGLRAGDFPSHNLHHGLGWPARRFDCDRRRTYPITTPTLVYEGIVGTGRDVRWTRDSVWEGQMFWIEGSSILVRTSPSACVASVPTKAKILQVRSVATVPMEICAKIKGRRYPTPRGCAPVTNLLIPVNDRMRRPRIVVKCRQVVPCAMPHRGQRLDGK